MISIYAPQGKHGLGKGNVWQWYELAVLKGTTYEVIDVDKPTAPKGNRILLMGQAGARLLGQTLPESAFNIRGEIRQFAGRPAMVTLDLLEAWEFKADKKTDKAKDPFGKDRAATQRGNWLFWIAADTKKLLRWNGEKPEVCQPVIYPPIDVAIHELQDAADTELFIDIETDIESDSIECIGFGVKHDPIFVVPIYRHTNSPAYPRDKILTFLAEFSAAMLRNTIVVHNAMFDLLWLSSHLRLPFGRRIFDTMVAHKRIHPEIEKSLGHVISYWTWQPYHKDEHTLAKSLAGEQRLWNYNAKDVFAMRLVYYEMQKFLASNPEYAASVTQANDSIYPYLLASLHGMQVDAGRLARAKQSADARIKVVLHIIRYLVGDPKFNPASTKQLIDFFHKKLAYKVVARTATGAPQLDEKAFYELALKYPNPLISAILHFREISKERSSMDFGNWIFPWETL